MDDTLTARTRSAHPARRCCITPSLPTLKWLTRSAHDRRRLPGKSNHSGCSTSAGFEGMEAMLTSGFFSMKLIYVSVPLDARLPTYPHNTPFTLEPIKRLARGDSSNVSTLHMSAHTGTHVDAPRHFFNDGVGTEALSLDLLIGRARVIEVDSRAGITAEDLAGIDFSDDLR